MKRREVNVRADRGRDGHQAPCLVSYRVLAARVVAELGEPADRRGDEHDVPAEMSVCVGEEVEAARRFDA